MIKIQLLFYLFQLLLCFPELGQVEGGDLLSLLDLLLVRLDLLLQFVNQILHSFVVLPVFLGLWDQSKS